MIHTTVCVSLAQGKEKLFELTEPSGDPFAQDWLVCPHPESVKWVSQTLATKRGLCAQIEVYPVGRWVSQLQSVIWPSMAQLPSLNRMTWATLEGANRLGQTLGPTHEITKLFGAQIHHEEEPIAQRRVRRRSKPLASKRLGAAQRFAKILRRLLLSRPHWLQAWDRALPNQVSHDDIWPLLWQEVSAALGPINRGINAPDRDQPALWSDWLELLCRRAANPEFGLGHRVRRLVFFGHHRYDAQTLALARACSQVIEVAFLTVDPITCANLANQRDGEIHPTRAIPLLTSYGGGFTAYTSNHTSLDKATGGHRLRPKPPFPMSPPPAQDRVASTQIATEQLSLLAVIQQEIGEGRSRPDAPQRCLDNLSHPQEDHSIRFHNSYSDQRQVEDLYQTLMASFRRDPTLKPRDVLVLCPDIERFAPLILAVFNGDLSGKTDVSSSAVQKGDKPQDVIRLGAEVSRPHGQNPFAHLLTVLLKLSSGRLYRHDVFQCLKHPLVSSRYRLSLNEILKLEHWIRLSGVRWGLDAAHRVSCGLNEEAQHSWEFGLDRLLMGTLVGDDQHRGLGELYGGVAPIPIGSEDAEVLLSRFCDFFLTLKGMLPKLSSSHTPAVWCEVLIDLLRQMTFTRSAEEKALRQDVESDLRRALKRQAPTQQKITSKAISLLVEKGVGQQRMVLGAGRDHVKFYSLDQSYGIPAKIVCFLNLSEGKFPYRAQVDRLDPMRLDPMPTDLDPLQEQFANLLTSVIAAQRQVHFFYTGQKANGEKRLPAPMLQAIQEELSARYQIGHKVGEKLIQALTIEHPLHSFSPRNFIADAEGMPTEKTISHEPLWLKGAQAWREAMLNPRLAPPFSERVLDMAARGVSRPKVETLKQLLKNPSEFFLKRGVGMQLLKDQEVTRERELLELDHLQSWSLKDRTFKLLMAMDPSIETEFGEVPVTNSPLNEDNFIRIVNIVRAEGLLPVGKMGEVSFEQALDEVKSLYDRFTNARGGEKRTPLSIHYRLPSGRPIFIEGDMCYGRRLVFATPSRHTGKVDQVNQIKGERLIEPWVYHVAMSATDQKFEGTTLVAKDGQFDGFPPLPQERATELLEQWVDLMEDSTLRPLRFDPELSWNWLNVVGQNPPDTENVEAFQNIASQWKRAEDLYVQQAYSGAAPWQPSPDLAPHTQIDDLQIKQITVEGMHPEFIRESELIFGDLSAALNMEED
jgi:exodeoxyribonuclease V gamma subunit